MDINQIKIKEEPEDVTKLEEIGFNYDDIIELYFFEDEIEENEVNFTNEDDESKFDKVEGKSILIFLQKLLYIFEIFDDLNTNLTYHLSIKTKEFVQIHIPNLSCAKLSVDFGYLQTFSLIYINILKNYYRHIHFKQTVKKVKVTH